MVKKLLNMNLNKILFSNLATDEVSIKLYNIINVVIYFLKGYNIFLVIVDSKYNIKNNYS